MTAVAASPVQGSPRAAHARVTRGSALVALLVAVFPFGSPRAESEVVNVAACAYPPSAAVRPGPNGPTSPAGTVRVLSNPVVTPVVLAECAWEATLSVDPAGTVPPGARLAYTIDAINRGPSAIEGARIRVAIDRALSAPIALTSGTAPGIPSGRVTVEGRFDASTGVAVFTIRRIEPARGVRVRVEAQVPVALPADSIVVTRGVIEHEACASAGDAGSVTTPVVPPVLAISQ